MGSTICPQKPTVPACLVNPKTTTRATREYISKTDASRVKKFFLVTYR